MAESSSHNHSSPKITPKEEPVTLDRPESPNPFLHVDHIEFSFDEITFTTNNEVALLYPSHPNSEYFREVSDFISKCCLKESFTRALTQYKEYLCEFWYTAKTLDDFKIWVSTPTGGIRGDIEDILHKLKKKTREKFVPYHRFISLLLEYMMPAYDNEELTINPTHVFSVHNWALKSNQHEGPPFTDHMKDLPSQAEKVPQGKKHGSEENTLSNTHLIQPRTKAQAILHLPYQWLVKCIKRHSKQLVAQHLFRPPIKKEPALSSVVIKPNLLEMDTDSGTNEESRDDEILKKIKLEDLSDVLKDPRSAFLTSNSPQDEPIIVLDESREKKTE
ncbi:hypothetical protein Tco_0677071, partial [Tanacetum coccineum]